MYKHILLPTDGSRLSGKAIKQGIQLAKSLGADITAFNVVLPYQQLMMDDGLMAATTVDFQKRFYDDSLKRSNLLVDKIKAEVRGRYGYQQRAVRGDRQASQKIQMRPDHDGVSRPQRTVEHFARQRNLQGPHAFDRAGIGGTLTD